MTNTITVSPKAISVLFQILMLGLGLWMLRIGVRLVNQPSTDAFKETYDTAYNYFILSGGIISLAFFLPRLQNLTIKDITISVKEELEQVKEQLNEMEEKSTDVGGKQGSNPNPEELKKSKRSMIHDIQGKTKINPDDPQKGLWGGSSKSKGRELSATVKPLSLGFYSIRLVVKSTNENKPLKGLVKFHLHDTFSNQDPVIATKDGIAELNLTAWGAFTVGAETDNGATRLELDLSELDSAPSAFRES